MSASPVDPPRKRMSEAEAAEALTRVQDNVGTPPIERMRLRIQLREDGYLPAEPEPESPRKRKPKQPAPGPAPDLRAGPTDLAAEFSLITSILARPEAGAELLSRIDPEHFAGDAYRLLIGVMVERRARNVPCDSSILADELRANMVFVAAGGKEILKRIARETADDVDAFDLYERIRALAARRRLISTARALERDATEGEIEVGELIARARGRVDGLASDPAASGWERPLLDEGGAPVPFPVEVLPAGLKELVELAVKAAFLPPEYLAIPCLTIAAAGIGRSIAIRLKEGWVEPACLYTIVIGSPGSGKSTGITKLAPTPIREVARVLRRDHRLRVGAWKAARQTFMEEARGKGKAVAMEFVERPTARRIQVDDITRERLARQLAENPYGLVMIHDEMSDWWEGMNQYKTGGGNDKQIFPRIWSGSPICVDRVSHEDGEPIIVTNPLLNICAGVQPDLLPTLSHGGRRDGFMDRWLLSYPADVKVRWSDDSVTPASMGSWTAAFLRLWHRSAKFKLDDEPALAPFTKGAQTRYAGWFDQQCLECESEGFPDHCKGPWVKHRAYVARLALILEQLHWAYGERGYSKISPVGLNSVEGAIALIDYFRAHFHRAHAKIHGGKHAENSLALDLLAWLRKTGRTKFRDWEARDAFRHRLTIQPHELDESLRWLMTRRAIRKMPMPLTSVGRPKAPAFELNPLLYTQTNPVNPVYSEPDGTQRLRRRARAR